MEVGKVATITKEVTTIRKKVATITKEVASIDTITNKLANRFLSQSFFKPKLLRAQFFFQVLIKSHMN